MNLEFLTENNYVKREREKKIGENTSSREPE